MIKRDRHPPEPWIVHPLPPAPAFVGRERELDALRSALEGSGPGLHGGVVALVGLGGAGKTALAARFLEQVMGSSHPARPAGLFVWSFYQEPDAGLFLQEAHRYFSDAAGSPGQVRGAALLHMLRAALSAGGRHLLILDGLERVQEQGGTGGAGHGRIEDPLLRGLLSRIAEGAGQTTALVTSRFPLSDLESYGGRGYRLLDVDGLDREAAVDLLRRRGVQGDDPELAALADSYGAHALTLDHLGGLIGQFLDGDPRRAPEAPGLTSPAVDRQALRLARLLRAYEEHLPPAEIALLCRLCLLRGGVTESHLLRLFLTAPAVHTRAAHEAAELVSGVMDPTRHSGEVSHTAADSVYTAIHEVLSEAPIAGPAEDFPRALRDAVNAALAEHEQSGTFDMEGFLRLYSHPSPEILTERYPLPVVDRVRVRTLGTMYRKLREHRLMPKPPMHHDGLLQAFEKLGWSTPAREAPDDLSPHDLERTLASIERRLEHFVAKHIALCCVREFCRVRQRRWSMAGPLATLDATDLRRALAALVDRHLVLPEADGAFNVHPAVRDHFARLGDAAVRGGWHDVIREQLVSLVRRPGRGLPEDKATLDLVEDAIHHTLESGRVEEAWQLYDRGLGGLRHLGWKLGEMARGLRILRGFAECPDRSALAWFLRALGELDQAYAAHELAFFRADVRLLQGRLPEVAAEGDSIRTATASYLMGDMSAGLPPDLLGLAVPRVQLLLMLGRLREAWNMPHLDGLYDRIGWQGDRVRTQLLLAEVARRQSDMSGCRRLLELASAWLLHSGSVEHLCLWHLVRARVERDAGDVKAARRAAEEGVHTARQGGLGLYLILLLNARAEIVLPTDPEAAESAACAARALASAPSCQFRWGQSEAGHLLGQALAAQWRFREARAVFQDTLALRRFLADPGFEHTERLLGRLPS